jgi:hypothetical protein
MRFHERVFVEHDYAEYGEGLKKSIRFSSSTQFRKRPSLDSGLTNIPKSHIVVLNGTNTKLVLGGLYD